jgi:DnaJ-class molecular chaperone
LRGDSNGLAPREGALGTGSLTALMADASATDDAATQPRECTACRGTGRVISNLGGTPHEEPCPWCEGTGRFIPGHDAQAARRAESGSA